MVFLSSALSVTKRFNKALAPKLLSFSLRLHESLYSAPSILFFSPSAISGAALLPLAQRLVSLEVQDDYRSLTKQSKGGGDGGEGGNKNAISSAWDNFVETSWDVMFEDRHKKLTIEQKDEAVEREAQRLYDERRRKRTGNSHDRIDELNRLGRRRVQLLETYIRPALLPTSSTLDFDRHLFTHHHQTRHGDDIDATPDHSYDNFVKWLRGEYLIAKYGPFVQRAMKKYPELRDDAMGLSTLESSSAEEEGSTNPLKLLPSVSTVRAAFGMKGWSHRKIPLSDWEDVEIENANDSLTRASEMLASKPSTEYERRRDGLDDVDGAAAPSVSEVDTVTIERIVHHKLRGNIAHSGPLNAYFEMRRREDSYELWTRDYILGLARYLLGRIEAMDRTSPKETIVLDVGAGDGRLAYFLSKGMEEVRTGTSASSSKKMDGANNVPVVVATDDGSWRAPMYDNRHIRVEKLSAVQSLDKYGPRPDEDGGVTTRLIVLCSWMPPGQDWTADFRRPLHVNEHGIPIEGEGGYIERLVEEYLLIGEADDGTCGHHWYTWGNADVLEDDGGHAPMPPYVEDGYSRVDLDKLSSMQFSRFDCRRSGESSTVSFRREIEGEI